MNCGTIREYLLPYLDETILPEIKTAVELHLETCRGCQQELLTLKETWRMLDVIEPIEASDAFRSRLQERLQAERLKKSTTESSLGAFFPRWVPYLASAAVVLLVSIILIINLNFPKEEISSPVDQNLINQHLISLDEIDALDDVEAVESTDLLEDYTDITDDPAELDKLLDEING